MSKIELVIAIMSSLVALVMIISKLIKHLTLLIDEKKYSTIFKIVGEAMMYVEGLSCLSGDEKKEKVMEMVDMTAKQLDVAILDRESISALIEEIIRLTKHINVNH